MQFLSPLIKGTLLKRYKRFLADIELPGGECITAHCANPGSMLGLKEPGTTVWLSKSDNPKRKLKYSWELTEIDLGQGPSLVGINTSHPNSIVTEAIEAQAIQDISGYEAVKREVKYGENSRIDILLESDGKPPCYVEVKNVHLMRDAGLAEFPDSVTARGAKHLKELSNVVRNDGRAVMLFLVQRSDAEAFALARDIDANYGQAFDNATNAGVEALCFDCNVSTKEIRLNNRLPITD